MPNASRGRGWMSGCPAAMPASVDFPVPLLANEIARRFPGRPREDYEVAAATALEWTR